MSEKSFYITTTLPYVNSDPHIGFAMEIVRADIAARYMKMIGKDVFFNTGTDEHGLKIFRKAEELKVDTQKYVDGYAEKFKGLIELLNLDRDIHFVRTTDEHHIAAAQAFWKKCEAAGDIYKKNYKVKYCVGCELEKTDSELVDNRCPIHPQLEIEVIEEENYFFSFSKYQQKLLDLYNSNPTFVIPEFRFNEIKAFVERGLEDFSISRLKSKMPWGVPVPGDEQHVMYVWFDALVNYISTLGWPEDEASYKKYWVEGNPVQYCGKDNLRQQSAMWQAMLMSAGLSPTSTIIINGFITSGGQKMSKSLGNVISPYDIVAEYGSESLRYFVARELSSFEDSDVTMERFKDAYNANLANGLGNLVSRVMKMATSYDVPKIELVSDEVILVNRILEQEYHAHFKAYDFNKASHFVWEKITSLDRTIQEKEPFKLYKTDPEAAKVLVSDLVKEIWVISTLIKPFLPSTAEKIKKAISEWTMPEPLFLRK